MATNRRTHVRVLRGLLIGIPLSVTGLAATAARAQVWEIAPDGEVAIFAVPAIYTRDAVQPIGLTASPQRTLTPQDVAVVLREAAQRRGLNPLLLEAVAWRESRFHQGAISPKGAIGVMQLMPGTARDLGVDPRDLQQNVDGGAIYLRRMLDRYNGNLTLALAAYNAGPGAVDRYGGVPPYRETQEYVSAILARLSLTAQVAPPAARSSHPLLVEVSQRTSNVEK